MTGRRIEFAIHDERFEAVLLEAEAPRTCEAIWDLLPFEGEVRHAHMIGPALTSAVRLRTVPMENPYALAIPPGAVLLDIRHLPVVMDGSVLPPEFVIVAGTGARMLNWAGFSSANYFAQVTDGCDRLAALARRVAVEGFTTLRMRKLSATR